MADNVIPHPTSFVPRRVRDREGWRIFVQQFREFNPDLPCVIEALRLVEWEARDRPEFEDFVPPPAPPETEFPDLYFIGSVNGPIKIGISVDPAKRLRTFQTGYPHKLELLAVLVGEAMREPEYHARFAEHRLEGEWFAPHPDLLAEIARLANQEEQP